MFTESIINYHKKTIARFYSINQSLFPHYNTFLLSATTTKKNPLALYINQKNNPAIARTKSREKRKRKKALLSYVISQ